MAVKTKDVSIPNDTPNDVEALIWSTKNSDAANGNLIGVAWNTAPTSAGVTIH